MSQGHQGSLPEGMPVEQVTLEWWAQAYGFTEDETFGLSLDALEWWPLIRLARAKAQETEQKREQRMQQAQAKQPVNGPRG